MGMFDNIRKFGSSLGNATRRLSGITLAHRGEIDSFFNQYYGFELFGNDEKRCKINEIELEWADISDDNRSGSVKTHSLEDRDSTLISSNVTNGNRKYSLDVILTDYKTENKQKIYDNIVELWQKKKLCTLSTNETIEDVIITKVSRKHKNDNALQFSLDFEVLEFAYLMRKGEVLAEESTVLNEEQKTGITGTKFSGIKWGGLTNPLHFDTSELQQNTLNNALERLKK